MLIHRLFGSSQLKLSNIGLKSLQVCVRIDLPLFGADDRGLGLLEPLLDFAGKTVFLGYLIGEARGDDFWGLRTPL